MLIQIFIVWLIFQILIYLFESKVNLRHLQSNKLFISQLDEGSFEIVYPFQIRDKKERIGIDTHNYFLNSTFHYKSIVIVIPSKLIVESRLKLVLNINDYLFLNETQFKKLDENGESSINNNFENCYYQGFVNGDSSSFVAISTCNGLWGVIAFENGTTLGIWPLDKGNFSKRHPHVLYRSRWIRDAACGAITQTSSEFLPIISSMNVAASALSKFKRDINYQMKYLEMAVIGDYNFIKEMNATDKEGIEYMLNVINIVDLIISKNLKIRATIVYAEVWMDAQRIDLHTDIQRTLSGSLDYITGHIYHVEKDASIVFTGGFFANSESISAFSSSVCTARSVAITKVIDSYSIHTTSQLVTHAIGHIIGIDHDLAECICQDNSLCVMNQQIGSIGSPFSWKFSKCSVARLHNVLQSEHFKCLLSRPFQASSLHTCGNGVVDGEEECDCGRRDECQDSCCDPITCTLRAHARCASHQACCHQCELRSSGYICRESSSVCDVPEMCDGLSGDCPTDGYFIDGVSCGINGHCWKGNCSDSEQQCKELWGFHAKLADDLCFDANQKGVEYGNCGLNRNDEYLSCSPDNVKCGTLHCKDGSATPLLSTLMSFNLQFTHNNKQIQCKAIKGSETMVALVKDGTHCAPGKVCIENACVPLTQVSAPIYCPSNNLALQCSGHGDCTTSSKCLCYDGWTGVSCDVRSNTSRRLIFSTNLSSNTNEIFPSFKVAKALDTATLFGILLIVGIFLILILICLLFCYRRQSSAELHRANTMRDKVEDEIEDNSCRAIKFGQMPSYREEKRKRKKNKLVYDALQRINEAAEDTSSLKSRESSVTNNLQQANSNDSIKNHINGSVKMIESRHNSNSNLFQINKQQQLPPRQQIFRSTDCINNLGQLSIANSLLSEKRQHPQQRCDDNNYYSDSLKKYSNSNLSQHNLINNFTSQHINPQNIYVDSIYHNNINHIQLQKFHNNCNLINNSSNNLNHLQNGIIMPTSNYYSSNRNDFCSNNYNTLTGNTENLLRQNTLRKQQSFTSKTLNFSERNGYATDSEVVTSGFGSGSTSFRFTTAGPLSERNDFSSPLSSVAGNSNRNSGENDVPHSLLSDTECLNNSETPPPLRLQSIQMLMKRLNSTNDDSELQHFNNLKGIGCGQLSNSSNEHNNYELNDMFISRAPTIEERLDNEYEFTSSNYHRQHQFNNKSMSGNGPLSITKLPEPPPASADSGHVGSNYDIQNSPSLFSDPFKLDLSN